MKAMPTTTRHLIRRSRSSIRCDRKVSWLSSIALAFLAVGLVARRRLLREAQLELRRRPGRRGGIGGVVRRGLGLRGKVALDGTLRLADLALDFRGLALQLALE